MSNSIFKVRRFVDPDFGHLEKDINEFLEQHRKYIISFNVSLSSPSAGHYIVHYALVSLTLSEDPTL